MAKIFVIIFLFSFSILAEDISLPHGCYSKDFAPEETRYYEVESHQWVGGYNHNLKLNYIIEAETNEDGVLTPLAKVYTNHQKEVIEPVINAKQHKNPKITRRSKLKTAAAAGDLAATERLEQIRLQSRKYEAKVAELAKEGDLKALTQKEKQRAKNCQKQRKYYAKLKDSVNEGNSDAIAKLAREKARHKRLDENRQKRLQEKSPDALVQLKKRQEQYRASEKLGRQKLMFLVAIKDPVAIETLKNKRAKQRETYRKRQLALEKAVQEKDPTALSKAQRRAAQRKAAQDRERIKRELSKSREFVPLSEALKLTTPEFLEEKKAKKAAKKRESNKRRRAALKAGKDHITVDGEATQEVEQTTTNKRPRKQLKKTSKSDGGLETESHDPIITATQTLIDILSAEGGGSSGMSLDSLVSRTLRVASLYQWEQETIVPILSALCEHYEIKSTPEDLSVLLKRQQSESLDAEFFEIGAKGEGISAELFLHPSDICLKKDVEEVINKLQKDSIFEINHTDIEEAVQSLGVARGWSSERIVSIIASAFIYFGVSTF